MMSFCAAGIAFGQVEVGECILWAIALIFLELSRRQILFTN
ncbi:hypothetical protein [Nostoc sphaeroides]|uniref:Uncharacterized protein n=1 Tax=Nostoc sphaeroides CCNUC1 TaxID=2653204 RepID=A0A5P8W6E0_9NOSO|nr:hypothetical protein [Nostoc sphaeroides]QFS47579.1 hypothetical protein GXM_05071 [Nostoc sphaeroides CCNUC1]